MSAVTAVSEAQDGLVAAASDDTIRALGELCDDTQWMAQWRQSAWEAFQRAPMPTRRDEKWRFTNLRGVDLASIPTFVRCRDEDAVRSRLAVNAEGDAELAARLVHVNGTTVSRNVLDAERLPTGVTFATLDEASREHPDLLQKYLGSVVPPTADGVDDKFAALQAATIANGIFLHVAAGVQVELPLRADVVMTPGDAVNWRALVVLEEGASATFVEEFASTDPTAAGFSNAVVELVVGANANLRYITVQDYAVPVRHCATHRLCAQRDAQVEWAAIGLGASQGKSRMEVELLGPGSNVKLTGAYFIDGRQELDYDTWQRHAAPNAHSDLAFKGVVADKARSIWRGMIAVDEGAQGTDAYQENRNLLLDSGAHADSIPGLQIEANEVRCTHGATIARVDQDQLFYLQARGIDRESATREIVRGFFEEVLGRITVDAVRDHVRSILWQRLANKKR